MSKPSPQEWVIRPFNVLDQEAVVHLWRECTLVVPWNDPYRDIRLKMQFQPDLFLVGALGDEVVATVMVGYDGHRGWINYLAVSPGHQGRGYGRAMMEASEQRLRDLGCPKINLQVRSSNAAVIIFYQGLGYSADDVISLGKRL